MEMDNMRKKTHMAALLIGVLLACANAVLGGFSFDTLGLYLLADMLPWLVYVLFTRREKKPLALLMPACVLLFMQGMIENMHLPFIMEGNGRAFAPHVMSALITLPAMLLSLLLVKAVLCAMGK